jgi:DNA-binding response OmpR family regulator
MAEKILIIDDDVDTLKLVGMMLQKQGYTIVAANNGPQGLTQAEAENPDLILLDVMMPEMDGYEVAKRLRANPLTSNTPILMFTAKTQLDDKVSGFESGADDYLTKPTHPSELSAHVKALLARSIKGRTGTTPLPTEKRAFTVGVTAVRGGLGVTTVAVNLGDAIRLATKAEVVVVELRPGMGTLGPDMGEEKPTALKDLITGKLSDMTRQNVKEQLVTHPTGLQILAGSVQPKDSLLLNALAAFEALVNRLSYLGKYLVLDLGAGLTPVAQKLLPACNVIVVIVEPVGNSVVHAKAMLTDLAEMGVPAQQTVPVVVNRIRSDTQLNWAQVEEQLGRPPVVAITPAPELLYLASRMKTTALATRPDSLTSQQFSKLAAAVLEIEKKKA